MDNFDKSFNNFQQTAKYVGIASVFTGLGLLALGGFGLYILAKYLEVM